MIPASRDEGLGDGRVRSETRVKLCTNNVPPSFERSSPFRFMGFLPLVYSVIVVRLPLSLCETDAWLIFKKFPSAVLGVLAVPVLAWSGASFERNT